MPGIPGNPDVSLYVRIERFRITEATKLEALADLAAVKGYPDLADDIRHAARVLIDTAPPGAPNVTSTVGAGAESPIATAPVPSPAPIGVQAPR